MSKSQVSRLAKSLDQIVEDFRSRPLDGAPYAYVTFDALVVKCREGGRTVNVCVVHAVGVNRDGFRESLGLDVVTAEDGAAWLAFLRSLVARGLCGVRLVTSDAHPGLVDAIAATLPGAAWQRCRTHAMRNLLTRVPKSAQSFVATMVRTIFAQPDAETVHEQYRRIVDQLETRFPEAAALLEEAATDLLAFTSFPKEHWRQLWSNNSLERLKQRNPPPHRRRRHLPRPAIGDPPGRRPARRAERRVGRRLPPLHERRVDHQGAHRPRRRAGVRRRRAPNRRLTGMNVATATNFETTGAALTASELAAQPIHHRYPTPQRPRR